MSDAIASQVMDEANRQGVDPILALAVSHTESRWNQKAISPTGAIGTMQVLPSTARAPGYGIPAFDPHDLSENIRGGVSYLKAMIRQFGGNVTKALAAYNQGPGTVIQHGITPAAQQYINLVHGSMPVAQRFAVGTTGKGDRSVGQEGATDAGPEPGMTWVGDVVPRRAADSGPEPGMTWVSEPSSPPPSPTPKPADTPWPYQPSVVEQLHGHGLAIAPVTETGAPANTFERLRQQSIITPAGSPLANAQALAPYAILPAAPRAAQVLPENVPSGHVAKEAAKNFVSQWLNRIGIDPEAIQAAGERQRATQLAMQPAQAAMPTRATIPIPQRPDVLDLALQTAREARPAALQAKAPDVLKTLNASATLTDWERNFVNSLTKTVGEGRALTEGQLTTLFRLYAQRGLAQ